MNKNKNNNYPDFNNWKQSTNDNSFNNNETPQEKAKRIGVPIIPSKKKKKDKPKDPHKKTIAVCGECGREVKEIDFYSCNKDNCPVQNQIKM